jgi:PAS domain S-box-containing protein
VRRDPLLELDQLYGDAPIGFAQLDRELRIVRINQRLAEFNGRTVAEHIGRPLHKMVPGIAGKVAPILRRVIKSGKPALNVEVQTSTSVKREAGKFWLASFYPFKSKPGTVLGVRAFVLNIGQRKEFQHAPGEPEALSRGILNSLRDQIAVLDSRGTIIAVNEAWQCFATHGAGSSLVGFNPGVNYLEACRRAAKESIEGAREALSGIRRVLNGARDHFILAYPSEQRWFRMSVTPLAETARGVVIAHSDVTTRKIAEREREELLGFETLLAELSAGFVHLPADKVDKNIEGSLKRISEYLKVERSTLFELSDDQAKLYRTHSYAARGVQKTRPAISEEQLPWWFDRVRRGQKVVLNRIPEDLPEEATAERQWFLKDSVKSHLAIPLVVDRSTVGVLTFRSSKAAREWPKEMIQRLELVGQVFVNALERKLIHEKLKENAERLRLLVETTNVIPWQAGSALEIPRSFIYVGPQAKKVLGYPIEDWYRKDFWASHIHPDDRESAVDFCRRSSRGLEDYKFDYRMISSDGQVVWIHDVVSVDHEDGLPKTLRGFMIDITRHKQDEENLNAYRQALRTLASELSLAQENERRQIADALHDRLAPNLALAKMKLGELRESLPVQHTPLTDKIRDLVDQTIKDTRSMVQDLCPQVLYQFGLEAAMDWLAEHVQAKYGLRCVVEKTQPLKPLRDKIQVVLFQAVRELLLNVAKHARATEARIILEGGQDSVKIQVVDDGCGFDPSSLRLPGATGGGFGLFSLRERLAVLGGELHIDSSPRHGVRVTLTAPLEP